MGGIGPRVTPPAKMKEAPWFKGRILGGPGCPLWGYRGGIATRSYQLSRYPVDGSNDFNFPWLCHPKSLEP